MQNSAEVSRAGWLGGDMLLPTAACTQGDELAPECAPYYFAYGDALLTSEDHTARDLADVGASGPGPFEEGEGTDAATCSRARNLADGDSLGGFFLPFFSVQCSMVCMAFFFFFSVNLHASLLPCLAGCTQRDPPTAA